MKKLTALVMALLTLLAVTACGRKHEEPVTVPTMTTEATVQETTVPPTTQAPTVPETTVPETTEAPTVPETTVPHYVLDGKFRPVDETVYATRNVNIRTKPSVQSSSPGKLLKDHSANRIGIATDGWSAVVIDGELYYIASEYLTTRVPGEKEDLSRVTEKAVKDVVYTTAKVNFRKGPGADTDFLGQIPKGTKLNRVAICSNGWCKVQYQGKTGYVAGNYVSLDDPAKATEPTQPKPDETRPAETKPQETKPAETKPQETKPQETKPEETKPQETKPQETKPGTDTGGGEDETPPIGIPDDNEDETPPIGIPGDGNEAIDTPLVPVP